MGLSHAGVGSGRRRTHRVNALYQTTTPAFHTLTVPAPAGMSDSYESMSRAPIRDGYFLPCPRESLGGRDLAARGNPRAARPGGNPDLCQRNRQRKEPIFPLPLGEGWGEGQGRNPSGKDLLLPLDTRGFKPIPYPDTGPESRWGGVEARPPCNWQRPGIPPFSSYLCVTCWTLVMTCPPKAEISAGPANSRSPVRQHRSMPTPLSVAPLAPQLP